MKPDPERVYAVICDAEPEIARLEEQLELEREENARLRCKLMPHNFISAPEAVLYLEDFLPQLVSAVERTSVKITIAALKRMIADPSNTAWWGCRSKD